MNQEEVVEEEEKGRGRRRINKKETVKGKRRCQEKKIGEIKIAARFLVSNKEITS